MKFIMLLIPLLLFGSYTKPKNETYGIDVSHHQGNIQWSKVKTWESHKLKFVYIKATEGATYKDPMYDLNIKGASKTKLLIGSYHYFRTTSSPEKQFKNFISAVDTAQQDLIPMIDLEEIENWDSETYHKNLKKFLGMVEKHFGKKPMLYTVNSFYSKNLAFRYSSYPILIGRYGNKPLMIDGKSWSIWQFTEKGKVSGIPKSVDINITNSSFSINRLLK